MKRLPSVAVSIADDNSVSDDLILRAINYIDRELASAPAEEPISFDAYRIRAVLNAALALRRGTH